MKSKLLSTSLVSIGVGACGLGLWKMQQEVAEHRLKEQARLLNPKQPADCVNNLQFLAPLGKKVSVVEINEDCMRQLELSQTKLRN